MKKFTSSILNKILGFAKGHKIISFFIAILVLGGGYWTYKTMAATTGTVSYVLGQVERTTIVSTVSASGQVSTVNQIDIKPKASGDITWVGVKAGDTVRAGQALAYIDSTDAKQDIADAEASLAAAKLQYQKDTAQAPIDYEKLAEELEDSKNDLLTTYNDTYNTTSSAFLELPTTVTGMQNILYSTSLGTQGSSQWNVDVFRDMSKQYSDSVRTSAIGTLVDVADRDYKLAREKYDKTLLEYKKLTRYSDVSEIEKLLKSSIDVTTAIAQALQSEINLLDAVTDETTLRNTNVNPNVATMRASAKGYLTTVNSSLSSLLNQQKSLDSTKKTIRDQERNIEIYKIGNENGSNPISLQSSNQSIANQERNLQELKNKLSDYTISAPFAGTVASISLKKYDSVSSGTTAATLITQQKVAQLSLNEVDATKINLGDKATLTFDAIEDLTLTGEVIEIDSVGTVSQGVVSYKVKIGFDSQDDRVKSGMTVNASVQTDVKQSVLSVPSSAVKTLNGITYVQVFDPALPETGGNAAVVSVTPPQQVEVTVGISDETQIEIVEGLTEGQQIVTRTISAGAANTTGAAGGTTQRPSGGFGGATQIRF